MCREARLPELIAFLQEFRLKCRYGDIPRLSFAPSEIEMVNFQYNPLKSVSVHNGSESWGPRSAN